MISTGQPMIVSVFEKLARGRWPVYIAGKGSFAPEVDAALDCAAAGRPLAPARSAARAALRLPRSSRPIASLPSPRISRNSSPSVLERLAAAWRPGDEAVVPEHAGGVEPLAALYDRFALLREGLRLRGAGRAAMRDLIAAVATRFVPMESRHFCNVNTRSDLERGLEPT